MAYRQILAKKINQRLPYSEKFMVTDNGLPFYTRLRLETDRIADNTAVLLAKVEAKKRNQHLPCSEKFMVTDNGLPFYTRLRLETDRIADNAAVLSAKVEAMSENVNKSYEAVVKETETIQIKEYHQSAIKQYNASVDLNDVRTAKTYRKNERLLTRNKIPSKLSNSLSAINLYELDHKLVERRMRNGFHDFKHGAIKDDLDLQLTDEELFEMCLKHTRDAHTPAIKEEIPQQSFLGRVKMFVTKFIRRYSCVGFGEEDTHGHHQEIIFNAF